MKYIRISIIVVGLIIIPLLSLVSPVFAITDPDSVSVTDISVNRHLIETNDMLIYAKYNIAYGTTPTETISDTFIFSLIDTDGSTLLGSVLAYPYDSNGFGQGVISFYYSAADAPTWGVSYYIRVAENPAYFPTPEKNDYIINSGDYTSLLTQSDNRDELKDNLIALAQDLEVAWSTTLTQQGDVGSVLNDAGAAYFRYSVVGLQSMCPEIFSVVLDDPDYTERSWNVTQATTYENRFNGTWVGDAFTGLSSMFGSIDQQLPTSMIILVICGVLVGGSMLALASPVPGILMSAAILPMGMMLGMFAYGMMAIIAVMCALYIGYWWFFARS